jgi:hypothetical protein
MTKEQVIIIALIAVIIYLYYQQNNQPNISDNSLEVQELKQQVNHYQTLYQKRVEKDLGSEEIIELKNQKISDLETSLLNLAKQKLKGNKDSERLLNDLEIKYNNSLREKETK